MTEGGSSEGGRERGRDGVRELRGSDVRSLKEGVCEGTLGEGR